MRRLTLDVALLVGIVGAVLAGELELEDFRRAAERGHAEAQFVLAVTYDQGDGVPEDDAEAVRWYRKAAEQGHALAQFGLGTMYGRVPDVNYICASCCLTQRCYPSLDVVAIIEAASSEPRQCG